MDKEDVKWHIIRSHEYDDFLEFLEVEKQEDIKELMIEFDKWQNKNDEQTSR